MLVLSRQSSEEGTPSELQQIVVDGPAIFTILKVSGSRVLVGIEADPSVKIWRGEFLSHPPQGDSSVLAESLE